MCRVTKQLAFLALHLIYRWKIVILSISYENMLVICILWIICGVDYFDVVGSTNRDLQMTSSLTVFYAQLPYN